ncbi:MAG: polysaccharide deacetylase family protein [Thermodesulfobacteriota bacterium]
MGKVLKISHLFFILSLAFSLFVGGRVLGMLSEPPGGGTVVEVGGNQGEKLSAIDKRMTGEGMGIDTTLSLHRSTAKATIATAPLPRKPSPGMVNPGTVERVSPSLPDIFRGGVEKKELSFTFDGGAGAKETEEILAILRRHQIRTTIFLTGRFIEIFPRLVLRMVEDGHEIGNHTLTHPHLTSYNRNARHHTLSHVDRGFVVRELEETARLFQELTGEEISPLWRAPYGEVNGEIRRWAYEAGYLHINWTRNYERRESLDSLDWVNDEESHLYYSSEGIKERILNFGRGGDGLRGGIVLMHLGTERRVDRAVDTLGETIAALKRRGYRFVKVSELLQGKRSLSETLDRLARRRVVARLDPDKEERTEAAVSQ